MTLYKEKILSVWSADRVASATLESERLNTLIQKRYRFLKTSCRLHNQQTLSVNKKHKNKYQQLLIKVQSINADLVAKWMAVGFIHGVMNTDNTSISGETIDYGPCAFMDYYDPNKVYSYIDHQEDIHI